MASPNAWTMNKKYFLLNNLGRKHSLLIKFDQFMKKIIDFFLQKLRPKN